MPQVTRRLPFQVINRRHQFRFQSDAVLATLDRFSCNTRPGARVMCLKKRDWVAKSSQFEPMFELSNEASLLAAALERYPISAPEMPC